MIVSSISIISLKVQTYKFICNYIIRLNSSYSLILLLVRGTLDNLYWFYLRLVILGRVS